MPRKEHPPEIQLQALQQELGLQLEQMVPEEEILRQLSHRVELLLRNGHGSFFQLMYRLDIPEKKLSAVIDDADAYYKIARLIYERQLQKIQSRKRHPNNKKDIDGDLSW